MPSITNVSSLELEYTAEQSELKALAERTFRGTFADLDRLLESFENSGIERRNLCVPIEYFNEASSFSTRNRKYVEVAVKLTTDAAKLCLEGAGISAADVTDFIFVSSTGFSTPSIDAIVVNELKLNPYVRRLPLWGLGCAGGTAGTAIACRIAESNPKARVLVCTTELCSLTFLKDDKSKSNLIATSLFSDGAACALVCGDEASDLQHKSFDLKHISSRSRLYYDTLDVMGWEMVDSGLKVIFSRDIPNIVSEKVRADVLDFLGSEKFGTGDVKNFIIHPGGVKVISAYTSALGVDDRMFANTRETLRKFGNMSSATVLYVLNEFAKNGIETGISLMASLGPGFTSEMLLLKNASS